MYARSQSALAAGVGQMVAVTFKASLGPPGLNWKMRVFNPKGLEIRVENKGCCCRVRNLAMGSAQNASCRELLLCESREEMSPL